MIMDQHSENKNGTTRKIIRIRNEERKASLRGHPKKQQNCKEIEHTAAPSSSSSLPLFPFSSLTPRGRLRIFQDTPNHPIIIFLANGNSLPSFPSRVFQQWSA
jgi:hypothetical protein